MRSIHRVPSTDDTHADSLALDRTIKVAQAQFTGGLSPISLGLAWADWMAHWLTAPGWVSRMSVQALDALSKGFTPDADASDLVKDARYRDPAWTQWPYSAMAHLHLASQAWWQDAVSLRGMEPHHRDVVCLFAQQWLDMMSPANLPGLNPQVVKATHDQHGLNLWHGLTHMADDWRHAHGLEAMHLAPESFRVGVDVACTPGKVVARNHLVELIQYTPQTPQVQREPVLIVPSWIMKYYILDLSPHNSMVRYLVSQGHTVFILSWRNPDESDALLDMEDYLHQGIFAPLATIGHLTGGVPVHAAGYCLGGTLLSIAAAALARPQKIEAADTIPPLKSLTLLAAQVDFREPGELGVLIDAPQVELLEDMMAERGYLTGRQMAGSFQFLHARDLIWSTRMREYLLGERDQPNDLMAWNADLTRLPAAMHSEYLHRLYLRNELAEERYPVEGAPVSLNDLRVPLFAVGTVKDHVSPWHSVFKIHRLTDTDLRFVLTNGGHNAGIVSEPGHAHRAYQWHQHRATDAALTPQAWQATATSTEGSWWPHWHQWLVTHSEEGMVPARSIDPSQALADAPGTYVFMTYAD